MAFRRVVAFLVVAAIALGGCGNTDDEGDAGIAVDEPVGAPETPVEEYGPAPLELPPSVAKSGRVEMEVPRAELTDAAQAVVDLATSDRVGGFLSSSVVDLGDGYGSAAILVKVPAGRFEQAVSGLSDLGEVTRQEMAGQDLAPATSPQEVRAAGGSAADVKRAEEERDYVAAQTAYAPIDVALSAKAPPPPPEESAIERSLGTAKEISLAIASGAIVGAGVVLPLAVVLLVVWLVWTTVIRRLRLRWEQLG